MDLTDETTWRRVRDRLAARGAMRACPSCSGEHFMLDRSLVTAPRLDPTSGRAEPNRAIRLAALICRSCAHLRLFAVDALGAEEDD